MEELTKSQLILLALLVSFVTSIATGIVTVTLMDQAPAGVTQTINRVVERTIERAVPSATTTEVIVERFPATDETTILNLVNGTEPALVTVTGTVATTTVPGVLVAPRLVAVRAGSTSDDRVTVTAAGMAYPARHLAASSTRYALYRLDNALTIAPLPLSAALPFIDSLDE